VPHYRVMLEGSGFAKQVDGAIERVGFLVVRFVEAPDERTAMHHAIDTIGQQPTLGPPEEGWPQASVRLAEPTVALDATDVPAYQPGFIFFPDPLPS